MRITSVLICLLLLGTASFSIYHIVLLFSNTSSDPQPSSDPPDLDIFECKENATANLPCLGLEMVTRHEWLAQPPIDPIGKLDLPATNVILTDTKTDECENKPKCKNIVRNLQDIHNMYTDDIAYNFLINSQGDIYEGRGWLLLSGETSEHRAKTSYWIALIGNFTFTPVREFQIRTVQNFVLHAKSIGKLSSTPEYLCSEEILSAEDPKTDGKYKKCQFFH